MRRHRISHTTAAVCEAEDGTGRRWALKRMQGDHQSVREAERLVKLKGHPLIVPLESVFVDKGITYLQMPFYQHGNLRTWVEQLKVSLHECIWFAVVNNHKNPVASPPVFIVSLDKAEHTTQSCVQLHQGFSAV